MANRRKRDTSPERQHVINACVFVLKLIVGFAVGLAISVWLAP